MKKCPSCQKTYEDNMKFCQSDGTPLVVVAEEPSDDPFKTMVAGSFTPPAKKEADAAEEPKPAAPPPESKEPAPPAGKAPAVHDDLPDSGDVLEIPEADDVETLDPMKTIVVGGGKTSGNIRVPDEPSGTAEESTVEVEDAGEAETILSPDIPKFAEPEIKPPDVTPKSAEPAPPVVKDSNTPGDSGPSVPIPSPFEDSMPPGVALPDIPPFEDSGSPPAVENAKPEPESDAPPASPFAEPVEAVNTPDEDWDSGASDVPAVQEPAAPDPFGSNSIFNTDDAASPEAEGENKTMAFVSLGLGIASFVCGLGLLGGLGAIVTGYMAKKNIKENPSEYGGGTLATVGMVLGALATVLTVLFIGLWIMLVVFQGF